MPTLGRTLTKFNNRMTKVCDAVKATLRHDSSFSYYATTTTTQSTNVTSAASYVTRCATPIRNIGSRDVQARSGSMHPTIYVS